MTALTTTQEYWPALQIAYEWVHQAASILENHDDLDGTGVSRQLQERLSIMQEHQDQVAALGDVVERFSKVTANYAPGLFSTYDIAEVPRTNNDLEQCFGSLRWHERRATGRKQAVPGLVVWACSRPGCRCHPLSSAFVSKLSNCGSTGLACLT